MSGGGLDGLGSHARRVAEGCGTSGHVAGNRTTGAYQSIVADGHARQDDRAAPTQTLRPMRIGRANSNPEALPAASRE
jgi:hypothetical protein